jgi:hypothetical protein
MILKNFFSVAKITPSSVILYSMDSHTISCVLSDIPTQINDVVWTTPKNDASLGLSPQRGVIKGTTQTSTLSLSSVQLVKLKASGGSDPSHIFTCRITVGTSKSSFEATQIIKIYTPGIYSTVQIKLSYRSDVV